MQFTSSAFADNQPIPAKYTCDGDNVNPPLSYFDIPTNTQSYALIVDDPDSPGGIFNHWLVWNIPPGAIQIEENSLPAEAVQGTNSFNQAKYGGPCPQSGSHRYEFKIYALDTTITLPPTAQKIDLEQAMSGHILGSGKLTGLYQRP